MRRIRLFLVAAALCLAVISPFVGPAYAWGGPNPSSCQYPCNGGYPYPYQYQYGYQYPYQGQYVSRYPYQYQYRYATPCSYPYPCTAGRPLPPPPVYYYGPSVSGLNTGYGDYSRCAQFGLHQANCFVPNSSNSPNLGSIQMEPAITIWGACTAGQTMNRSGTNYQCSKTGAGWFPQ